ncbi:MAG: 4-hydroxy-tetrahydrodipicolinate synthase [Bacteroidota bacterium]
MKKQNRLIGTGTALITPFNADFSIDFKSLGKIVDHQIKNGVDYLVVLGTTGESVTLDKSEKEQVVSFIKDRAKGRVPIVVGVGGNNTSEVVHALCTTDLRGVEAVLSVSPYYNKPNQEGLYKHFSEVAKASPVPVLLYNVPGRTGSNMLPETTLRIAKNHKNVIGIKEASGNMDQIMSILKHRPKGFLVISGDDSITLPLIASGADGVISVVSNAFPKKYSEMVRLCLDNKWEKARKLHYELFDLIPLLFAEGSPSGVKCLMEMQKLCSNQVRMPLAQVSQSLKTKLAQVAGLRKK